MNFKRIADTCSHFLGSSKAFFAALTLIFVWALSGPFFHFNTVWQLVANTFTTLITFLAMFLLQHSQNADTKAIHLKLDELLLKQETADNRFMHAELAEEATIEKLNELHETNEAEELEKKRQAYYHMGGEK